MLTDLVKEKSTLKQDIPSSLVLQDETVIRANNIGKCYHIYDKPQDRLKQAFLWGRKKLFRDFWALNNVSFKLKKGETLGIIGRNGSGKSTLLQLLCGTIAHTRGDVVIKGRVAAILELGAGFNFEFTGRENVYMNASILGLSKDEIDASYEEIVKFADIGDFIDQPVKIYSSGMVVRLAFAIVANVDADILIIDEALAVGDAFFVQKCMRFLRNFREKGTILFVSHDSAAVVNLCHRTIWLEHGMMKMMGSPKDICEAYLAAMYEAQQGPSAVTKKRSSAIGKNMPTTEMSKGKLKDQRLDFLNHTQFRNDIQLYAFNPDNSSFGKGSAVIEDVVIHDEDGSPLSWIVGGELVKLVVRFKALQDMRSAIVGFLVKDRLGQYLFSDNTYLTYINNPQDIRAGEAAEALFHFQMPILPAGDYSVAVSIAEGTQQEHIQHHWIFDALSLKSHSSSVCTGLVGIPMIEINIRKTNHDGE